jgi:hypothetical protein
LLDQQIVGRLHAVSGLATSGVDGVVGCSDPVQITDMIAKAAAMRVSISDCPLQRKPKKLETAMTTTTRPTR